MDSIGRETEPDPGAADWIVGARLDDELLGNSFPLCGGGKDIRVEGVVWVFDQDLHRELAAGAFIDSAGDADGAMKVQASFAVEGLQGSVGELDAHVGDGVL